jgi:DNA polymerase-3 subunit delta'
MNRNAANALLKTLEEPPPEGIFLLVSTRPARLPVTIRSRCQRINFTRVDHNTGVTWLMGRAGVADEQAAELLNLAQGRPLLALDLAGSDLVSRQVEVLSDLGRLIKAPEDVTGLARKWQEYGAQDVFRWLMGYMLRMARIKLHESKEAMEPSRIGRDLHHIANQLNLPQLVNSHDLAMQHYRAVTGPFNLNPVGLLEDFIIYWQAQYQLQEKRR